MDKKFAVTRYTERQLENAKTRGQVVGWIQGAAVTFGGMLLFKFLGWIPVLLLIAASAFLGFKFWRFLQKDEPDEDV